MWTLKEIRASVRKIIDQFSLFFRLGTNVDDNMFRRSYDEDSDSCEHVPGPTKYEESNNNDQTTNNHKYANTKSQIALLYPPLKETDTEKLKDCSDIKEGNTELTKPEKNRAKSDETILSEFENRVAITTVETNREVMNSKEEKLVENNDISDLNGGQKDRNGISNKKDEGPDVEKETENKQDGPNNADGDLGAGQNHSKNDQNDSGDQDCPNARKEREDDQVSLNYKKERENNQNNDSENEQNDSDEQTDQEESVTQDNDSDNKPTDNQRKDDNPESTKDIYYKMLELVECCDQKNFNIDHSAGPEQELLRRFVGIVQKNYGWDDHSYSDDRGQAVQDKGDDGSESDHNHSESSADPGGDSSSEESSDEFSSEMSYSGSDSSYYDGLEDLDPQTQAELLDVFYSVIHTTTQIIIDYCLKNGQTRYLPLFEEVLDFLRGVVSYKRIIRNSPRNGFDCSRQVYVSHICSRNIRYFYGASLKDLDGHGPSVSFEAFGGCGKSCLDSSFQFFNDQLPYGQFFRRIIKRLVDASERFSKIKKRNEKMQKQANPKLNMSKKQDEKEERKNPFKKQIMADTETNRNRPETFKQEKGAYIHETPDNLEAQNNTQACYSGNDRKSFEQRKNKRNTKSIESYIDPRDELCNSSLEDDVNFLKILKTNIDFPKINNKLNHYETKRNNYQETVKEQIGRSKFQEIPKETANEKKISRQAWKTNIIESGLFPSKRELFMVKKLVGLSSKKDSALLDHIFKRSEGLVEEFTRDLEETIKEYKENRGSFSDLHEICDISEDDEYIINGQGHFKISNNRSRRSHRKSQNLRYLGEFIPNNADNNLEKQPIQDFSRQFQNAHNDTNQKDSDVNIQNKQNNTPRKESDEEQSGQNNNFKQQSFDDGHNQKNIRNKKQPDTNNVLRKKGSIGKQFDEKICAGNDKTPKKKPVGKTVYRNKQYIEKQSAGQALNQTNNVPETILEPLKEQSNDVISKTVPSNDDKSMHLRPCYQSSGRYFVNFSNKLVKLIKNPKGRPCRRQRKERIAAEYALMKKKNPDYYIDSSNSESLGSGYSTEEEDLVDDEKDKKEK